MPDKKPKEPKYFINSKLVPSQDPTFPCPECGCIYFDPDDNSNVTFTIENVNLGELDLKCVKCGTVTRIYESKI